MQLGKRPLLWQRLRNQLQHRGGALGREPPERSGQATQPGRGPEATRIGQRLGEDEPQQAVAQAALAALLGVGPVGGDELVVAHARGAGRDARVAPHAAVDERGCLLDLERALEHLLHQEDPAAGRVHLLAEDDVGGARGQAEAAVDALLDGRGHLLRLGLQLVCLDLVEH
jgi:hypothetical protein